MADAGELLKKGLSLNTEQEGIIIRAGWVIVVTGHIAWVCGFLSFIGLSSPFVQAGELTKQITSITKKQDETDSKVDRLDALLRQNLAQSKAADIRYVLSRLCKNPGAERDRLLSEKERLKAEYAALVGFPYIEPPCEQLR